MKIEDINYTLPTEQINSTDFDIEKWRRENPIDYFKLLYLLFTTTDSYNEDVPRDIVMKFTAEAIFHAIQLYIPDTLFKFYSFNEDLQLNEKKLTTLQNKQIYMSDIKDFNDPFDGKAFFYNPDDLTNIKWLKSCKGKLIDDFTTFIKGTALTKNDTNSMPMWAHYANNHQGFCVSYDMTNPDNSVLRANTFPVQYTNQRLDITSFMKQYTSMLSNEFAKHLSQGKKDISISDYSIVYIMTYMYNVKHTSWQYENEFRCTTAANAKGMPYIDAAPKAIYIGMNCTEDNRNKLINIAETLSIPIYQMRFNDLSESYTLRAELL